MTARPDTRARIEHPAAAPGFVPDAGARNLSMVNDNAIGVVRPDLHGGCCSEIHCGIDRVAGARGHLLPSNVHDGSGRSMEALAASRGRVDGMIWTAPHLEPNWLIERLPRGPRVVLLNCAAALIADTVTGEPAPGGQRHAPDLIVRETTRLHNHKSEQRASTGEPT